MGVKVMEKLRPIFWEEGTLRVNHITYPSEE